MAGISLVKRNLLKPVVWRAALVLKLEPGDTVKIEMRSPNLRAIAAVHALLHGFPRDHSRVQQQGIDGVASPHELVARCFGGLDAGDVDCEGFEGIGTHTFSERLSCGLGLLEGAARQDDAGIAGLRQLRGSFETKA
jgi:hypothetical protein